MAHLHAGRAAHVGELLVHAAQDALDVGAGVLVLELARAEVRVEGEPLLAEGLAVGHVQGQFGGEGGVGADADGGLVAPGAGDVAGGVATAAEDEEGDAALDGVAFGEGDAGAVAADVEVEATQAVVAEGVGAALEDDGGGVVVVDGGADDVLEEVLVRFVVDAVVQRHVDAVAVARVVRVGGALGFEGPGAGEEVLLVVFVEGDAEDAVGGPEGLFDSVAVVDIDVDVEDARMVAEELEDGEDDVVHVAEAAGFALFRVVEAAGPVDGEVGLVIAELAGGVHAGAGVEGAVLEEPVEDGAVVADAEDGAGEAGAVGELGIVDGDVLRGDSF